MSTPIRERSIKISKFIQERRRDVGVSGYDGEGQKRGREQKKESKIVEKAEGAGEFSKCQ